MPNVPRDPNSQGLFAVYSTFQRVMPAGVKPDHLWVIVKKIPNPGARSSVLAVSVTTPHKPSICHACVLFPADHPFIAHKSVIAYQFTWVLSPETQDALLSGAKRVPPEVDFYDPVKPEVITRIINGAKSTKMLSDDNRKLFF